MSTAAAKMTISKLTMMTHTKASLRNLILTHLRPAAAAAPHFLKSAPKFPTGQKSDNRVTDLDPTRFATLGFAEKCPGRILMQAGSNPPTDEEEETESDMSDDYNSCYESEETESETEDDDEEVKD